MSIELILGPMFSGKTSELFRRLNRAKYTGQSTIVFKYIKDRRYLPANGPHGPYGLSRAVSHDLIQVNAVPINDFGELSELPDADVIGIDEGQFIGGAPLFAMAAAEAGKRVIISALDSDFRMMPWKNIQRLIPVSEQIDKLHAVCFKCKRDASFTKRLDSDNEAVEDIGGADKYVASCRLCFFH
jgi:thymidine kinase